VPSHQDHRYRSTTCGRTVAATTGTPFYRRKHATELVTTVLTLLCQGCPLRAVVVAFGLDERPVAAWQVRAGQPGQRVHEHLVEQGQVDLGHVQADERGVKRVGRKVWVALALAVPSRRWLGGSSAPTVTGRSSAGWSSACAGAPSTWTSWSVWTG
jgi:hypothetical protein